MLYRTKKSRTFPEGGWEVRYRDNRNKSRRKRFRTKQEALNFQADVRTKKVQGEFIDPRKAAARFEDVAAAWERTISLNRKPTTVSGYRHILRAVAEEFGGRMVSSIEHGDIQAWIEYMSTERELQASTVRNIFRVLKMVLDQAVRDKRISSNPCAGVVLPRGEPRDMLFLTSEQVAELAGEIPGPLIRFGAYTGLRAGEIAALRVKDLDLKKGIVYVRRSVSEVNGKLVETEPKTKAAQRTVGIPAFVLAELREYLGERAFNPESRVFVGPRAGGDWRHANWYRRSFKPAVDRLVDSGRWPEELRGLRFHDLRHTYASFLVEQGAHPKEMAEAMGHSSVQITLDRYSHLMPHLRDALTRRLDEAYKDVRAPESKPAPVVPLR